MWWCECVCVRRRRRPPKIFSPLSRLTYSASITVNQRCSPARPLERWRERRDVFFALYRFNVRFRACKGAYNFSTRHLPLYRNAHRSFLSIILGGGGDLFFLPLLPTQMGLCLPNACPYFGQCFYRRSPARSLTRSKRRRHLSFLAPACLWPACRTYYGVESTIRMGSLSLRQQINKMCFITVAAGKERTLPRAQRVSQGRILMTILPTACSTFAITVAAVSATSK